MKNIHINKFILYRIYISLFFVSGFAGLIYQSIWTHYLKLFLGHAAYSQVLVLVIFMGGMALGSWVTGKYSSNIVNLLLCYAIVEGVIGLYGIFFHSIYTHVIDYMFFSILPRLDSSFAVGASKWITGSLLIFPQAVLLGSTFPLMSAGLIRNSQENSGRLLAVLYFCNSIGAALGVLMSGFVFIEKLGLPGTIQVAGGLNLIIALIVWLVCRENNYIINKPVKITNHGKNPPSQSLVRMLLACAAFTGVASFVYEIVWIRMLSLVLGSSTHAFELMLSAFILGLAIGAFWIRSKIDQLRNPIKTLAIIQIVMGLLALTTLIVYNQTFYIMSYIVQALSKTNQGYFLFNLFSHSIALFVMLPATICAGMTLPIISHYLISNNSGEGSIGKVYALNTTGAIAGVFLAYQLISFWGLKNLIVFGSGIDIIVGLALLWKAAPIINRKYWGIIATGAMAGIVLSLSFVQLDQYKMVSGVFRIGNVDLVPLFDEEVIFHKDGKTASIDVVLIKQEEYLRFSVHTNGKSEGSLSSKLRLDTDEPTQILLAALPASLHPKPRSVAIIGMGTGQTRNTILKDPGVDRVDIIEIEPAMVEAATLIGKKLGISSKDPRSNIFIEDARTFFPSQKTKYDLIISEPSNPWVSGVSNLFTKEFYHLLKNYINEDGLFIQWMHLYEMNMYLILSVINSIALNFNDYVIYNIGAEDIIIVANTNGEIPEPSERIFAIPQLKSTLNSINIISGQDLMLTKLGSREIFDPLIDAYNVIPNSDYFPFLDINAVKARYLRSNAMQLLNLRTLPLPIIPVLEGSEFEAEKLSSADKISMRREKIQEHPQNINQIRRLARNAKQIFNYFQASNNDSMLPVIDTGNLVLIQSVSFVNYNCDANLLNTIWLNALHSLAQATLPFLSPNEMNIMLNNIQSMKCFNKLSEEPLQWFNLYKAVGSRDYNNILKFSSILLPEESIQPSTYNHYLLTAAMLANIALDDKEGALSMWERYDNESMLKQPFILRLLFNYCM